MNLVLYYAPNTCALAPYVTLTEANATFEVRPLNFRKGENKSPDYLRINPKHKVPLLVIDGEPLSESTAIQLCIARNFPQAKLMPSDPWQELKAISLMSWCSSGIHPYLSRINSPPKVCDVAGSEASVVKAAREVLFQNYKIADDLLAGREFFFDHFTAPDAHVFWCLPRTGTSTRWCATPSPSASRPRTRSSCATLNPRPGTASRTRRDRARLSGRPAAAARPRAVRAGAVLKRGRPVARSRARGARLGAAHRADRRLGPGDFRIPWAAAAPA